MSAPGERRLLFVCPECQYMLSMTVESHTYMHGGLCCECGTSIHFTLDTRLSTEYARREYLKAQWRNLRGKVSTDEHTSTAPRE